MAETKHGDTSRRAFQIAYDGGLASGHSMDVEALAPALLAFGKLIRESNSVLNQNRATVKVLVTSDFEHKCFNVNFEVVQSILQHIKTLLDEEGVQTATELLKTIGIIGSAGAAVASLFGFLKWKQGKKLQSVKRISDVTSTGSVVLQIQIEGHGNSINNRVIRGPENPQTWSFRMGRHRRSILNRESAAWKTEDPELSHLVEAYEEELRVLGAIDFDDMPLLAVRALRQHAWLQRAILAKFPVLVVDEYQDLGRALHGIVMGLCFTTGIRLFAVGDADQSVYGFTGDRVTNQDSTTMTFLELRAMRSILGTVWSNNRNPDEGARRSLREGLKARLVNEFPELAPIYCGSINVRLDEPLKTRHDFEMPATKWGAYWDKDWGPEAFGFQRIKFQYPEDGSVYDKAWIWTPSLNNNLDDLMKEILAEEVPGLRVRPETSGRIAEFSEHEAD